MVRDCRAGEPGEWAIEPATLPEHMHVASVRITLADDGHYYLDVRRKPGQAFRADSRHSSVGAALERGRATLCKEVAL
jgi:hypothetical protein